MEKIKNINNINVIVVDDHIALKMGLSYIFAGTEDITLIGSTDNLQGALQLLSDNPQTDVLILDIEMPQGNGLNVLRKVKTVYPRLRVLMYSMHPDQLYAPYSLKSGAMGYLNKSASIKELLHAVWTVAAGSIYMKESLNEMMIRRKNSTTTTDRKLIKPLSVREIEVINLLMAGKRNRETADELGINEKTVSTYKARVLKKLRVKNIVELIAHQEKIDIVNYGRK